MRRKYNVCHISESGRDLGLPCEHVECGARDPSALKRVDEGELIDNGSARGVDQERGWLHQRELAWSDLATSFRPKGRVDRNEVGSPQQFVEQGEADVQFPLDVGRLAARGPVQNFHLEAAGAAGDGGTDAAPAADQAQGLAGDASSKEMVRLPAWEHPPMDELVSVGDAARYSDHQTEAKVRGCFGDKGRRRRHNDAAPRSLLDIDVSRRDGHRCDG